MISYNRNYIVLEIKRKRREDYMKYEWIEEYLMKKAGVTKDLQKDWIRKTSHIILQ